ncbi:hypothetical protein JJB11_02150 [Ramlibacter ginsenosidimutans]|uniref:ATP-grasp domain-containing protein n=2 Tax=Ramlibacter ginsenosidimutans TaxID=502333 RepID=A0A934WKU8_9BURK|nr:hypothetical protein [Ramlibacter ginsenosidimutans]MBK6004881.1 hypothetical protein [Ramlibacter ginsenosidimutans]
MTPAARRMKIGARSRWSRAPPAAMSYIAITLNHMRAVKAWADAEGAEASLDLRNCELEVRCRNRFFRFHPRFLARREGRLFHTHELVDYAMGFIGWLPYGIVRYELSDDKLAFKSFAAAAGLKVPARWPADAPRGDYILKSATGSFGYEITGPYRSGSAPGRMPPAPAAGPGAATPVFAEEFVEGDALKAWFWGSEAFFAHRQAWPCLRGDGTSSVRALLHERLGPAAADWLGSPEQPFLEDALAFQHLSLDAVPAAERAVWLDFRYGRTYAGDSLNPHSDSILDALPTRARADVDRVGAAVAQELQKRFPAPVLFAVDGVLDAQGQVWWLEVNSNPTLPPDGYAHIFSTLFGPPRA